MGVMGSDATKELRAFRDQLVELQKTSQPFLLECASKLVMRLLPLAKKRTPVGVKPLWAFERAEDDDVISVGDGVSKRERLQALWAGYTGGNLRRSWRAVDPVRSGNLFLATLRNSAKYASYVEEGHRQTPGRYVPHLGLRLKAPWVPGRHMLKLAEQELEPLIPGLLQDKQDAWLKRGMQ